MRPFISRSLPNRPVLRTYNSPYQPYLCHHLPLLPKALSRCHIFWDLDNVQPTLVEDIPIIGEAIKTALLDLLTELETSSASSSSSINEQPPQLPQLPQPPPPPPQLTVFANPTTLQKFSATSTTTEAITTSSFPKTILSSSSLDLHQAVVQILGGTLVLTTGRKQSVDFAMKSAMLEYVQKERKRITEEESSSENVDVNSSKESEKHKEIIIVACVSDDTDYVQVLNYLGSTSTRTNDSTNNPTIINSSTKNSTVLVPCRTVSIGEHKRRKRPAWAAPRKLDSLALPAACDAAITLYRPRKKSISTGKNGEKLKNLDEIGMGVVEDRWRVESVWVNPNRNQWKDRIE